MQILSIEIRIWRNEGAKGEFCSASTPTMRYKDEAGEWKDGRNFGRYDLAGVAREAATKIRDLQKSKAERGRHRNVGLSGSRRGTVCDFIPC